MEQYLIINFNKKIMVEKSRTKKGEKSPLKSTRKRSKSLDPWRPSQVAKKDPFLSICTIKKTPKIHQNHAIKF
jgi:hypothetical protein